MLAVPGWCDSHRLPNAVPVASAENNTARAVADPSGLVRPARRSASCSALRLAKTAGGKRNGCSRSKTVRQQMHL